MGRLILVGLLAVAVALVGTPAFAEVQNIKVSGDIDAKAIIHKNYDLKRKQLNNPGGGASETVAANVVTNSDDADFLLTTTRIRVDADLTDNVSTSVRLLNQRPWGVATSAVNQIHIDNAYVTLKEFLYSPLTIIAGRQDLKYGTGFIVGPGLLADPNGAFAALVPAGTTSSQAQIGREFSAFNSYDAIRMILDFAPITVEGLMAKITETGVARDDQTLYGAVVNYKLDRWSAEIEPYWFYKMDESAALVTGDQVNFPRVYEANYVHTFGVRTAAKPIENLMVNVEGAYQSGWLVDNGGVSGATRQERDRHGWAGDVDVRYNWASTRWTPTTGLGWVYYSGGPHHEAGEIVGDVQDRSGNFTAWDPMYRGSFTTYIQDFLAGNDAANLYATFDANDSAANTNRQLLYGDFSLNPIQDVTLWARYTHAWFARTPVAGRSTNAGDEVDAKVVYNYTDDVQFGLFTGVFFPGTYYAQAASSARGHDAAWTLGGDAAVKF